MKHVVSEHVLFSLPNTWVYNKPVCYNNITKSDIVGRRNFCEIKTNSIIDGIYSKK